MKTDISIGEKPRKAREKKKKELRFGCTVGKSLRAEVVEDRRERLRKKGKGGK